MRSLAAAGRLSGRYLVRAAGFLPEKDDKPSGIGVPDRMCCGASLSLPEVPGGALEYAGEAEICESVEDALDGAEAVLLPLPVTVDGEHLTMPFSGRLIELDEVCRLIKQSGASYAAGGRLGGFTDIAARYDIEVFDYYDREDFAVANAVPTAEGAICIAMRELPVTIDGMRAVVVGYGRIGKLLSAKLKALGADVTTTSRRAEDLAWTRAAGIRAAETSGLSELLHEIHPDVVFNTVPRIVLGEKELSECRGALIVDLASKPGGVDIFAAGKLGMRVIWALSLPGRTSPVSAGRIIADIFSDYIEKAGGNADL